MNHIARKPRPAGLFLCTTLQRTDTDGDTFDCDMIVSFEVATYSPGCPAVLWGNAPHPAECAEYEFNITGIEFDGAEPDDAPGPLTDVERVTLTAWFKAHHDDACVAADGHRADDFYDRADYEYDRWKDEQMERGQ